MYLLRSMAFSEVFMALSTGIRVRTCDTNWRKLRELNYLAPPINQQRLISEYLDRKCTEIDLLVADIQNQIDTLEQYKRSVITEAVTKGLNPDVEMRDSGIPWLDKLPQHWNVIPSKYLFRNSDVRRYSGDVQLTASQNWGIIPQEEYMERTGAKIVFANHGLENWKHVEPNDFVISLRSFQGGLEMSEVVGCITWHYVVLKAAQPIASHFYKWLFKSDVYIAALQRTCNFIRDGQDLRYSNFSQVPIYIPPINEQQQIADYLDERCTEIDGIIAEKRVQLSVLDEYKKSLIFEYVTGKKEVPTATTPVTITAIDPHIILAGVAINGLGTKQLGKIQLEKVLYLFDYYLGLGPGTQYYRFPHGPYDLSLDSYLVTLQGSGWFKKISSFPEKYLAGESHCDFCDEAEKNSMLLNAKDGIDKVISFIKTMKKTSQVERVATLFAAWNDFLIDGITPSDDQIIREVMNNWTENKGNTQYLTWKSSLDKLKRSGIVPKGMGLHTLPMQEGGKSDA